MRTSVAGALLAEAGVLLEGGVGPALAVGVVDLDREQAALGEAGFAEVGRGELRLEAADHGAGELDLVGVSHAAAEALVVEELEGETPAAFSRVDVDKDGRLTLGERSFTGDPFAVLQRALAERLIGAAEPGGAVDLGAARALQQKGHKLVLHGAPELVLQALQDAAIDQIDAWLVQQGH